jgi:hypothetical protein
MKTINSKFAKINKYSVTSNKDIGVMSMIKTRKFAI